MELITFEQAGATGRTYKVAVDTNTLNRKPRVEDWAGMVKPYGTIETRINGGRAWHNCAYLTGNTLKVSTGGGDYAMFIIPSEIISQWGVIDHD